MTEQVERLIAMLRDRRYSGAIYMRMEAADLIESLSAEKAALEERLEIPEPPFQAYDGIVARDETIKLLDARVERLSSQLAEARGALEEIADGDKWHGLTSSEMVVKMRRIARAALPAEQGEE
jgi:hypothetical protein